MITAGAKEWWQEITDDLPFNMHVVHRPEDATFVVGEQAKRYVESFLELYGRATGNCILTTIAGFPGTGKSYILAHLTYRMIERKEPPGIPVIVRLVGQEYHPTDFVNAIRSSGEYQRAARAAELPVEGVEEAAALGSLRHELNEIRARKPHTVLCLFVDNVDEYIRLMGGLREREQGLPRDRAWAGAMLSLLRPLNAINDALGAGVCTVVALTPDIVETLHLADSRDQENLFTGLVGQDSTLRRRFFPIHESDASSKLHVFGPMERPDASQMVGHNLELWFGRHPEFARETRPECQLDGCNVYPFQAAAIERIYAASEFPGEVILGCLSSINRYHELRSILAGSNVVNQSTLVPTITESVAASGILQMSQYFRKVNSGEVAPNELRDIVVGDSVLQYAYILPQEVASLQLAQGDVLRDLGSAFVALLRRLTNFGVQPVSDDPVYIKTKGRIRFPKFPTFDCLFRHEQRLFGVQFLTEDSIDTLPTKVETGCRAVLSEPPGAKELANHVHSALFVCMEESEGEGSLASEVARRIWRGGSDWSLLNSQGRDFRPRAAIAVVPEQVAWSWKVLSGNSMLRDEDKQFLAFLMENVEVHYWRDKDGKPVKMHGNKKWPDFLDLLGGLEDIPPRVERPPPPPDVPGFDR